MKRFALILALLLLPALAPGQTATPTATPTRTPTITPTPNLTPRALKPEAVSSLYNTGWTTSTGRSYQYNIATIYNEARPILDYKQWGLAPSSPITIYPADYHGTDLLLQTTNNNTTVSTGLYAFEANAQTGVGTHSFVGRLVPMYSYANNRGTGTVGDMTGLQIAQRNLTTGTVTTMYGTYYIAPVNSGGGAVTNVYAHYVNAPTVGGSNNYAFYSTGGNVHFGGTGAVDGTRDSIHCELASSGAIAEGGNVIVGAVNRGFIAPRAGSITAYSLIMTETINAGSAVPAIVISVAGSETIAVNPTAGTNTANTATYARGTYTFTAGQALAIAVVNYTGSASTWTATNVQAILELTYN